MVELFEKLEPRIPPIVIEARHQDTLCCMGKSELDHRGETVVGVSPDVQESLLFSLKVSAEVSKVDCNPRCFGVFLGPLGSSSSQHRLF